ncbi:MAG TPA: LPS assembly lipoprotein LptE, partial [Rhizomicrobium sp.]|nr:LPS assembly lipoprotein LptE [Rhizomicrobium sp.]
MKRVPLILLCAPLALSGCGFHPLYGSQGTGPGAGQLFSSIYVEPVANRVGYELRDRLIDLLDSKGDPSGARYKLKIDLTEDSSAVALQSDSTITRYNYLLKADYTLSDAAGNVVTHGHESTLSAYNIVGSPYASIVDQQDAEKRGAYDLSER